MVVGVTVGVKVGVTVGVIVGVAVGVPVGVAVGVAVGGDPTVTVAVAGALSLVEAVVSIWIDPTRPTVEFV